MFSLWETTQRDLGGMRDQVLDRELRGIEVDDKSISALLEAMADTGFQGRSLGEAARVWEKMVREPDLTIVLGLSGYLSTTGQWKLVRWLIELGLEQDLVCSSMELLDRFGHRLGARDINTLVAAAAHGVPVFCPAVPWMKP